jgi:hypothetical protein
VRHVPEGDLAWALIDAAKPHLTIAERNYAFVTVGAGDTFPAILALVKIVAAKRIPLHRQLLQQCATWLDAYNVDNEYDHVRHVIKSCVVLTSSQAATAIRPGNAAPKIPPPLAVTAKCRARRQPSACYSDLLDGGGDRGGRVPVTGISILFPRRR